MCIQQHRNQAQLRDNVVVNVRRCFGNVSRAVSCRLQITPDLLFRKKSHQKQQVEWLFNKVMNVLSLRLFH